MVFILITLLLIASFTSGFAKFLNLQKEHAALKQTKAQLHAQKRFLTNQLSDAKEDKIIELQARLNLGLIKPGETEYRFTPPTEQER